MLQLNFVSVLFLIGSDSPSNVFPLCDQETLGSLLCSVTPALNARSLQRGTGVTTCYLEGVGGCCTSSYRFF